MIGHNAFSTPITLDVLPHHTFRIENLIWDLELSRKDDVSGAYDNCQAFMNRFPKDRPLDHDKEALAELKAELVKYFREAAGVIRFCQEPLSKEEKADKLAQATIDQAIYLTSPKVVIEHDKQGAITFVGVAHGDEASHRIKESRQEQYPDRVVSIRTAEDYCMPE